MSHIFRQLFLPARFFVAASVIITLIAFSFIFHWLFPIGMFMVAILLIVTFTDWFILTGRKPGIEVNRVIPGLLSLGDDNKIAISLKNKTGIRISLNIIDELPYQLQVRDFLIASVLKPDEEKVFDYLVRPVSRGKYSFGKINIFLTSQIGFIQQKLVFDAEVSVSVFPSVLQMKKYELSTNPFYTIKEGVKRHRRIGHSYEFDQIKEYVIGDDSRSINWKASGRKGNLMVNQYEDERSQQVYSIIDKSRVMRMPFNNLTLLDYAINTTLVISNIVLQKHDKAGLITFSNKIGTILSAERNSRQLRSILEALYNEQESFLEAEYHLLYHLVRNVIKNRSLIFLYTNFESYHSFERILPILRQISKFHLLVVIFFENEEVTILSKKPAGYLQDIYVQTIARKYLFEKNQIISELTNHGIHSFKTSPDNLSIDTINKYLELKSRGMI